MKRYPQAVARLIVLLILLAAPISLFAVEIVKGEASRTIDGTVDDDVIVFGKTLRFAGSVESLVFFGETLFMTGENTGNLITAAKTLEIDGRVADDTFAAGQSVSLSGQLGSTTFVAGETVSLAPQGVVHGSLLVGARSVEIAGTIHGDLYVGAGSLVLSGTVHGDVTVGAGESRSPRARLLAVISPTTPMMSYRTKSAAASREPFNVGISAERRTNGAHSPRANGCFASSHRSPCLCLLLYSICFREPDASTPTARIAASGRRSPGALFRFLDIRLR